MGKQDQYISAFGGLTCLDIEPDGQVNVSPLLVSNETLRDLEEHLCMFFTHYSRPADVVLAEQRTKSESGDRDMVESLHFVKENGLATKDALENGDTAKFAALMDEHWRRKRQRSSLMSNDQIDRCYEIAMDSGALGGKLVGAGSGGFLLFYAKDLDSLRSAMAARGSERGPLRLRLRRVVAARPGLIEARAVPHPGGWAGHAHVPGHQDRPQMPHRGGGPALRPLAARVARLPGRRPGRLQHRPSRGHGPRRARRRVDGGASPSPTSTRVRSSSARAERSASPSSAGPSGTSSSSSTGTRTYRSTCERSKTTSAPAVPTRS